MDPARKTFVLGLGAQKAGTTWVHRYISQAAHADLGPVKEYHVWDAISAPDLAYFDKRNTRLKDAVKYILSANFRRQAGKASLIRKMQESPEFYFEYFKGLLDRPGISMTGDITPSYCSLADDVLRTIREGFGRRRVHVKAIFLMRDPVERCWSTVRMHRERGNRRAALAKGVDIALPDADALLQYARTDHARIRTDYPSTLQNMSAVFPKEDAYVGFYENLFSREQIQRLSVFLGIRNNTDFAGSRFNASPKQTELPTDVRDQVRAIFRNVYEEIYREYPCSRSLWKS